MTRLQTYFLTALTFSGVTLNLDVVKPWAPDGWEQLYPCYPLDTRRN